MKKFFAVVILFAALSIGTACAEPEADPESATAVPAEINHAESIYFAQPDFYNMTSTADRIILPKFPTHQQETAYSCGGSSALCVLNFFGNRDFDEAALSKALKSKPKIGTSLGNMVKFFRAIGWNVQSSLDTPPMDEETFQKFVVKNLSAGNPIMVENIEWGGHWRVIIGIDSMGTDNLYDDVLIFADSFDTSDHLQDGYAVGSLDRFFSMWFDYNMLPQSERNQPWLIATPNGRT